MSVEDEVLHIQKKLSKMSSPDGEVSIRKILLFASFCSKVLVALLLLQRQFQLSQSAFVASASAF